MHAAFRDSSPLYAGTINILSVRKSCGAGRERCAQTGNGKESAGSKQNTGG